MQNDNAFYINCWMKKTERHKKKKSENGVFGTINIPTFSFNLSKIFLQLLVLKKFSIFTFSPFFKENSYVEFIFLNKILQKNS